ncbi:MAG: hypothetical protein ACRCUY_04625, partial [Thermoguttaceae bacterium]
MRKFIWNCLGVVLAVAAMQFALAEVKACNACDPANSCDPCAAITDCNPCDDAMACNPCDDAISCTKKSPYFWGAWVESGVWANEYGRRNTYNNGTWNTGSGNTAVL